MKYRTQSADETLNLGEKLGHICPAGTNILLDGDLAAGKTVFAKGLGKGLDIKEHIKSPSYTLLCIYEGTIPLYHFDAYNLNGVDDFYDLGFNEYISSDGVAVIEWASVLLDDAEDFLDEYIHISVKTQEYSSDNYNGETAFDIDGERILEISAVGDSHKQILKRLEELIIK